MKRPPKRTAKVKGGRPIDRLTPSNKAIVLANVEAFLAYVKVRTSK